MILTLWFWATPILLPEEKFPPWAGILLRANPLVAVVRTYRDALLGHEVALKDVAATAGFAITAFVGGGLIFRYMKRGFADVL